jgi:hypothetical protein
MVKITDWKCVLPALALGVAALAFDTAANAHGSDKPKHGGVVQMVGETFFELVTRPGGVDLYVRDDDEDVVSAVMTAKLTITSSKGAKSEVALAPAGGNRFEARGVKVPAGSKVAVMLVDKATLSRVGATFAIK